MAECLPTSPIAYQKAIDLLQHGEIVVLPTETVYGAAVLADNHDAVNAIYSLKNRPHNLPLSVCVFTPKQAHEICEISPLAQRLINAFWPGPLTLVLPKKQTAKIATNVNAGLHSIGLRCPNAPWREAFISAGFNSPIVLTSANTSGQPSPATAQNVIDDLGHTLPLIIDGGHTCSGMGSTIISVKGNTAELLRAGAMSAEGFAPLSIDWGSS